MKRRRWRQGLESLQLSLAHWLQRLMHPEAGKAGGSRISGLERANGGGERERCEARPGDGP